MAQKKVAKNQDPFRNLPLRREFTEVLLNLTGKNELGHHEYLIGMLIDQHSIYMLARNDLRDNGFYIISTTRGDEVKKVNPAMSAMNDAMKNFLMLLKEFGLTPQQSAEFHKMLSDGQKMKQEFSFDKPS